MSKARLVITAVIVEGRTQSEVAQAYGVSQGWISRLVARYQAETRHAPTPLNRTANTVRQLRSNRMARLFSPREAVALPPWGFVPPRETSGCRMKVYPRRRM